METKCPLLEDATYISTLTVQLVVWITSLSFTLVAFVYGCRKTISFFDPGTTKWYYMSASYFSTAAGGWILLFMPYTAYTSGLVGLFFYSLAIVIPHLFIFFAAKRIKKNLENKNIYNLSDWILLRYGRTTAWYVSLVMIFATHVYVITSTLTLSNYINHALNQMDSTSVITSLFGIVVQVLLYTLVFGFHSSIFTDRIQAVVILVTASFSIFLGFYHHFPTRGIQFTFTEPEFNLATSQILGVFAAGLFDFPVWQRVFATKAKLGRSLFLGATRFFFFSIFLFCFFVGLPGLFVRASQDCGMKFSFTSYILYFVGASSGRFFVVVQLILFIVLQTSTLDSYLNAVISLFSKRIQEEGEFKSRREFYKNREYLKMVLAVSVFTLSAVGISTYLFLTKNDNVVNLFYIVNVLFATITCPVFLGLFWNYDQRALLQGAVAGFFVLFLWGVVEFGSLAAGFEMLALMSFTGNPSRCRFETKYYNRTVFTQLANEKNITSIPDFFDDVGYQYLLNSFEDCADIYMPDVSTRTRTPIVFLTVFVVSGLITLLSHKKH